MNTSANTNQIHDTTTSTVRGEGIGFLRRSMVGALLAAAITATGVGLAATSLADDGAPAPNFAGPARADANCKTEPWGFLGSQRRTLCDGPIAGDGSWSRERTIWVPAHYSMPLCTSSGGGSYSSYTSCSGGYFVNQRLISNETYPVRPDTVLPDEPGHLG
ncbi:CDGP domain-containing protein [Mycobacterium sp.]|uniref:CDGP domain-containing protein n=1 Tax=Mycobacterium sp. TaxID=1785 RepID=UPI003F9D6E24